MLQKFHSNPWYAAAFFIIVAWLAGDMAWLGMEGIIFAVVGAATAVTLTPVALHALRKEWNKMINGQPTRLDFIVAPSGYRRARYAESEEEAITQSIVMPTPNRPLIPEKRQAVAEETSSFDEDEDNLVFSGQSWCDDDEQPLPSTTKDNGMFTFSQVLDKGFVPSLNKIYLGRLTDGTDVYVTAKDLCHVALAGLTGNGKSSIMRLIMAQLCKIGVTVLLLNPHYMQWDHSGGEDWTPYEPYLEKSPIDCAGYETIETYLEWTAKTLLSNRIKRAREGKPIGKPFFIVIDELPAIVAESKDVPNHIAKLLREGRKYGIFLIVASQDFQVKTIGFEGGGVRKCFKTAFYVGGDVATAKALLNDDNQKDPIPENDLGKGTIMLRCSATKKAVLTKVPYVDNESLYRLLGKSTFSPADEKPSISEQSKTTLDLDTVLALAKSEKVDGETLLALINQLPDRDEDGKDIDTEELATFDDDETKLDREPVMSFAPQQNQDINISQTRTARHHETPKRIKVGIDPITKRDVTISQEQYDMLLNMRRAKLLKGYRSIVNLIPALTEHYAKNLNRQLLTELGETQENECESAGEDDVE